MIIFYLKVSVGRIRIEGRTANYFLNGLKLIYGVRKKLRHENGSIPGFFLDKEIGSGVIKNVISVTLRRHD